MANGESGGLIVHAQKLVVLDLKPKPGPATIRRHQMAAKPAWGLHRLQPLAIPIYVQVNEYRNYFQASIANVQ